MTDAGRRAQEIRRASRVASVDWKSSRERMKHFALLLAGNRAMARLPRSRISVRVKALDQVAF